MRISSRVWKGRRVWDLDNDAVVVTVMEGGGHIAALGLLERPGINPLWEPAWRTLEPWQYKEADRRRYDSRLLASIYGHNLCLSMFGEPSDEERAAGLGCHGEAPVVRWKVMNRTVTPREIRFRYGADLPIARMRVERTLSLRRNSNVVHVDERVKSLARYDRPFTMCEHVTFGPPFLEKGVTLFDMSATEGHTFPRVFGKPQRVRVNTAFQWPSGPGLRGDVDLRLYPRSGRSSSDFTAQRMDPSRPDAWFSATNPRLGMLVAYVWHRKDFPWCGNWEENQARQSPPWNGKSLTRGMEFANTPFPVGLREAVNMGRFMNEPTFAWLPARGGLDVTYSILVVPLAGPCRGIEDIRATSRGFEIDAMI